MGIKKRHSEPSPKCHHHSQKLKDISPLSFDVVANIQIVGQK